MAGTPTKKKKTAKPYVPPGRTRTTPIPKLAPLSKGKPSARSEDAPDLGRTKALPPPLRPQSRTVPLKKVPLYPGLPTGSPNPDPIPNVSTRGMTPRRGGTVPKVRRAPYVIPPEFQKGQVVQATSRKSRMGK